MADFYMGCDVSKGYADFVVLGKRKCVVEKAFQVDDTSEGHSALSAFLTNFFVRHPGAVLHAGVESTGGYEDNWYGLLRRLGEIQPMKVARLNPLAVKKHHEASMKRNVTDGIAAENIASYMISYPEKVSYGEDMTFGRLRKQWNFTQLLTKQRTQLINQLGFLVYQSHPGVVRYCKKGVPNWVLDILSAYPTAQKLGAARSATVARIPYVSGPKAKELIAEAKRSVAAHVSETDGFIIRETVRQLRNLDQAINTQKQHLSKTCLLPEVSLLCSFKGIQWFSAVGLLINIVSIARFPTVKHMVSYFGLHPVYKQSGDGSWGYHMSKRGRKQPRAILFMVTLSAMRSNPIIEQLYASCLAENMDKMAAIGVCMHKILRVIYGMLKTNRPFDSRIDERNRKGKAAGHTRTHGESKRRLQPHDETAPISRRQTNTRKKKGENKEPQENAVPMNGVIPSLPVIQSTTWATKDQRPSTPSQKQGQILMEAVAQAAVKKE
jgi:transposase